MWSLALLENTLKINMKTAEELFKVSEKYHHDLWSTAEDVCQRGLVYFNPDHYEHMDFLWQEEFQKVLKKNKAKGKVLFADLEGDQFGTFWGYDFNGKGEMRKLKGSLIWTAE